MCMMLYLSSNIKLPEVPWIEHQSFFKLKSLEVPENTFWEKAKAEISKKTKGNYIYTLLAHTGCGCGFAYGINPIYDESDQEEEEKSKKSVELLFSFLKHFINEGGQLELYSCVADKEGLPNYNQVSLNISSFNLGDSFGFSDGDLIIVSI